MVELIPKARRPKQTYPVADIFFKISLAFVAFSVLLYGGVFLLAGRQASTLQEAEENLAELFKSSDKEIHDEITLLNKEISHAKTLTKELVNSSDVIGLIEGLVHPNVQLTSLSFDAAGKKATLTLQGRDIRVFWEQVRIFRETKEVTGVDVRRFSLGKKGEALFDVTLSFEFTPNFFVWAQDSL